MDEAASAPTVSVVVPTYNRPQHLRDALDSLRRQTFDGFECIVVDDASPEPIELPIDDARFRLLRQPVNGGVAAARNAGLRVACGTYIAFLDDDDQFAADHLARALDVAANSGAACVVCAAGEIGTDRVSVPTFVAPFVDTVMDRQPPHLGQVLIAAAVCPVFDEAFDAAEDLDWWLHLSAAGVEPVGSAHVGWLWRRHDGPRVRHGTQARIAGTERLLAKHASWFATHPQARAYRLIRLGWLHRSLGNGRTARRYAFAAVRSFPRRRNLARAVRLVVGR